MRPSSASAPTPTPTSSSTAAVGRRRWPWPSVLTTARGVIVGLPALRMTGIYLTIATLAFAVIIQEVFTPLGVGDRTASRAWRWTSR